MFSLNPNTHPQNIHTTTVRISWGKRPLKSYPDPTDPPLFPPPSPTNLHGVLETPGSLWLHISVDTHIPQIQSQEDLQKKTHTAPSFYVHVCQLENKGVLLRCINTTAHEAKCLKPPSPRRSGLWVQPHSQRCLRWGHTSPSPLLQTRREPAPQK